MKTSITPYVLFFLCLPLMVQGQFRAEILDRQVSIGYGLAIGDMDGDGKPDIILADKSEYVWYQNGDWLRRTIIEQPTQRDNVCLTARDLTGDGQVEIAVGAQWNPGNTQNAYESGSVHLLRRPDDTQKSWGILDLYHEPTIHRMHWVRVGEDQYQLLVLPLHGIGNQRGEGEGVNILAYPWTDANTNPNAMIVPTGMHMTHNFDVIDKGEGAETIIVGGKEGIQQFEWENNAWKGRWLMKGNGFGELRMGNGKNGPFIAGIEPLHGNLLTVYHFPNANSITRKVLTEDLAQGHALACADLLGKGYDQIVVGWRNPNAEGKTGIRLYDPQPDGSWEMHLIDDNVMACEDLKVADLNGDGKLDIIAAGRASHNLIVYWNEVE